MAKNFEELVAKRIEELDAIENPTGFHRVAAGGLRTYRDNMRYQAEHEAKPTEPAPVDTAAAPIPNE